MKRRDSNRHKDFGELFAVRDLERRLEKRVTGLDKLERVIDFEVFRPALEEQTDFVGESSRGGRPAFDLVVMFKMLVLRRNTREENRQIKEGEVPEDWMRKETEAKVRKKDFDARWTRKHGRDYYGYKNHVKVDAKTQFIEDFVVTDAAVHDSQSVWSRWSMGGATGVGPKRPSTLKSRKHPVFRGALNRFWPIIAESG